MECLLGRLTRNHRANHLSWLICMCAWGAAFALGFGATYVSGVASKFMVAVAVLLGLAGVPFWFHSMSKMLGAILTHGHPRTDKKDSARGPN